MRPGALIACLVALETSSKHWALQVTLQRAMLLARACNTESSLPMARLLLHSQLMRTLLAHAGNPVWFCILGLTERHRLPWERAAGSAAAAPLQQEKELDTRLMGELQHFGVVAQIVVSLDQSDTAWVKFVDIFASACCLRKYNALDLLSHKILIMQADLIMLGNNNNVQIERYCGPPT